MRLLLVDITNWQLVMVIWRSGSALVSITLFRDKSQIVEKCPIPQCCRILQKIPGSGSGSRWLPKFNQFFPVHRYICGKIFVNVRSVVFTVTVRQTDKRTEKRRALHNVLDGGITTTTTTTTTTYGEQSSGWHYICFITDSVSAKTENTFISAVISGHYYVACLWLFSPW